MEESRQYCDDLNAGLDAKLDSLSETASSWEQDLADQSASIKKWSTDQVERTRKDSQRIRELLTTGMKEDVSTGMVIVNEL